MNEISLNFFTAREAEGCVFTGVCLSTRGAGSLSLSKGREGLCLGGSLSGRSLPYGYVRAVRILLE